MEVDAFLVFISSIVICLKTILILFGYSGNLRGGKEGGRERVFMTGKLEGRINKTF